MFAVGLDTRRRFRPIFPRLVSSEDEDSRVKTIFIWLLSAKLIFAVEERPNILWLTAEDHGPHLGCYGDEYATTPHLDRFSQGSLRFMKASSNAPICAPARTTLITGMYASALGAHHMRSAVKKPGWLKLLPELLKAQGYYCSNRYKTDYNFMEASLSAWDDSGKKAHYKNRNEGQPFFAVFNQRLTHESRIRNDNPTPLHDPAKVPVPPYHPDTPEVRKDWAQYYDRISQMDAWFGKELEKLEEAGLAEDTIVFFFSDHGSGMPRSKRYVGWSGLHVPLMVHIPEKWAHLRSAEYKEGGETERLIGFVDLAPTVLALTGHEPVGFHQGHRFLGEGVEERPSHSFGFVGRADERPDESRSVTDGRYLYIRNFMPRVPQLKGLAYQMKTPTTAQWRERFLAGSLNKIQAEPWTAPKAREKLFDLREDPHEVNNIIDRKPEVAAKMRKALGDYFVETTDLGLLPEPMMHRLAAEKGQALGDFARGPKYEKITQSFRDGNWISPYKWIDSEKPNQDEIDNARAKLESLSKGSSMLDQILLLEFLIRYDFSAAYVDKVIPLTDPKVSGAYAAFWAFQALEQSPELNSDQLERLRQTNTVPGSDAHPRFAKNYQNYHEALLAKYEK